MSLQTRLESINPARLVSAGVRQPSAEPLINLSSATNPEAGFSSNPSITREVKSGAASYIAPSELACTVFRGRTAGMRTSFHPHPDIPSAASGTIQLHNPAFAASAAAGPRLRDPGFKIFRMQAVQNQNAAHQRVASHSINDVQSRFAGVRHNLKRLFHCRAMQIHQRLHQIFSLGPHRRIGDRFHLLDQLPIRCISSRKSLLRPHSSFRNLVRSRAIDKQNG